MGYSELILDSFAGGGGGSAGIERALGRPVDYAWNHDEKALGMHRINHPFTQHFKEDVFAVNPAEFLRGRRVGLYHASPDCTDHSKAKNGKPRDKRIRGLVLVILKWAKQKVRVITMENVEEIEDWGPLIQIWRKGKLEWHRDPQKLGRCWFAFLDCLSTGIDPNHPDLPEFLEVLDGYVTKEELVRGFGYKFEYRHLRGYHSGAPTTRNRLFMVARCDGRPIVWPEAAFENPEKLQPHQRAWPVIAECLDFTRPCPSIFLRGKAARKANCRRPLKKNTLRRIAHGVGRFVIHAAEPFIVNITHSGGMRVEPVNEPGRTITGAKRGEKALCAPTLAGASIVKMRGTNVGSSAFEPLHTISAEGTHHALSACYMAQHNGGFNTVDGRPLDAPLSPITTRGSQQQLVAGSLAAYYGSEKDGQPMVKPARTLTTKARLCDVESRAVYPLTSEQVAGARRVAKFLRSFGVEFEGEYATVKGHVIVDIGMRMLTPRELFLAQGFDADYVIDRAWVPDPKTGGTREIKLTKEEQIRMCGNSVCPPVMEALVKANVPELCVNRKVPKWRPTLEQYNRRRAA